MFIKNHRRWRLMLAILSLSLLTVMAGAAVAPALDVIQQHFSHEPVLLIHLIISIPALFIAITNLFFGKLCTLFKGRTLTLIGLLFYVVFGCAAGLCSNIYTLLICRALVGVGVGIIMPMSTGLITYYFTRDKQDTLMGYSSAMNNMGGVIATLIAGFLAMVSWRLSFLVYLLGLISIILVLLWMPNERIFQQKTSSKKKHENIFAGYYPWIVGMFLLMVNFFNYPSNFALEVSKSGVVSSSLVPIIMAGMDIAQFTAPTIIAAIQAGFGSVSETVTSYEAAILLSVVMLLWVGVFDRKKD